MKLQHLFALFAIMTLALFGCTSHTQSASEGTKQADGSMSTTHAAAQENASSTSTGTGSTGAFAATGTVLAGTTTPYIDFNTADYEKALAENKVILLNFYANWCSECRAEQPRIFAAFSQLDNPAVVGFRVNYKDSDTNSVESQLAEKFGITYQHTKVIIKNGQRALKAPDSWDEQRYLSELSKFA